MTLIAPQTRSAIYQLHLAKMSGAGSRGGLR